MPGFPEVDPAWVLPGNGVSEQITMMLHVLLDDGDEMLIPSPDYPLWTATTSLARGVALHYRCDEENGWQPDLDDIRAKITPRTKAIVVVRTICDVNRRESRREPLAHKPLPAGMLSADHQPNYGCGKSSPTE